MLQRRKSFILTIVVLHSLSIDVCSAFSSQGGSNGGGNRSDRHMSAAQRERRDEEQRRKERTAEVLPGKTSAIPGAKDFELNVQRTESEWNTQASGSERLVREYTAKGMDALRLLRLEEADEAFNALYQIKPNAYCWQSGIVKFYLEDYRAAAELFAQNANNYESKFDQIASEERIWRDACELKMMSLSKKKHRTVKPPLPQIKEKDVLGPKETRKVVRISEELYRASVENDLSAMTLARAKLRSICGEYDGESKKDGNKKKPIDQKMWRLNSWYYLGLHYDVLGDNAASKDCMKMALRQCVSGNGIDIIQILPMLHMAQRDWFDDDEFEEDDRVEDEEDDSDPVWNEYLQTANVASSSNATKAIEDTVDNMKLADLQNELKRRGLKSSGSKSALRDRMKRILLEEAGLD